MRTTRSTAYGLLAVGYIAKHQDKKIILSTDISNEYDIPLEYLLKLLQQLVRANVLRSKRGPRGGFSLAKPPSKISMLQIIEAVDGPITNYLNLTEQAPGEKFGAKAQKTYGRAIAQARSILEKTKVSTLLTKR